ncbi:c2H2-type zinc finger domain-containing protein [Phthorimaea operculella]|nr:c2H2-type zinc finger domain-containing protein [Phthorimaea operculella]
MTSHSISTPSICKRKLLSRRDNSEISGGTHRYHQISRCHAFKELVERNDVTLHQHAKYLQEEAAKQEREKEKVLINCMDPQYTQYIEIPLNNNPMLDGFFNTEQQTEIPAAKTEFEVQTTAAPEPDPVQITVLPSTSAPKEEEALNSDEENYLQLVVFQATSTVSPGRHVCNLCHKEFKHARWLKQHMRSHSNWIKANCKKPPMCHICERTFKGPGMLKMHMRTHEARPPKQPTCSVCQRTFATKTLLYRHRQTHFEQKTHQCTVCEKRFFSGYALRSHMARHRGERPYICSMCSKSFYNPTDLKVRN